MKEKAGSKIAKYMGIRADVISQMDCCSLISFNGQLVLCEELQKRLWSDGTFIEFENSLNLAIKKLCRTLDKSSNTTSSIDTFPCPGYRFVHSVEWLLPNCPGSVSAPSPSRILRLQPSMDECSPVLPSTGHEASDSPEVDWPSEPGSPLHRSPVRDRTEESRESEKHQAAEDQSKIEPGELLIGRMVGPYEIVSLMGRGGMGEVYRARDTRLDRTVALKILPADSTANTECLRRFRQEARTISALNHPHICTLYDSGEHNGRAFLVMEYLAGETLAERLKKGPISIEQTIEIGAQIADALDTAHQQGIVHRDLKPGNVVLTRTGAKLIDFGLAQLKMQEDLEASATEAPTRTTPGLVVGTLEYMSPEQLEGRPVDERTDLWALGVMLYEMLTGKKAFERPSRASSIAAILEHNPVPLTALQPLTPPPLDCLVRRCLAKCPNDRCASASEIAKQLRWILNNGGTISPICKLVHRAGKWKWVAIGVLIVVVVVLKVGAGL